MLKTIAFASIVLIIAMTVGAFLASKLSIQGGYDLFKYPAAGAYAQAQHISIVEARKILYEKVCQEHPGLPCEDPHK